MLEIAIPGLTPIKLVYLLCDINGTIAVDGQLMDGLEPIIKEISRSVEIHLLSADTLGTADRIARTLDVMLHCLQPGNEAEQKAVYLRSLGADKTLAIGQGANDERMLKEAALGICVLSKEGTASRTMAAADILVPDIYTALELIQKPTRIMATLRQ